MGCPYLGQLGNYSRCKYMAMKLGSGERRIKNDVHERHRRLVFRQVSTLEIVALQY